MSTKTSTHHSDSKAQRDAEKTILDLAAKLLNANWINPDEKSKLNTLPLGANLQVDGISEKPRILAEVYASPRHKGLKPGQRRKIASDILKLISIKHSKDSEWAEAECVLLFSSEDAKNGVTGWLKECAEMWEIRLIAVNVPPGLDSTLTDTEKMQGAPHVKSNTD